MNENKRIGSRVTRNGTGNGVGVITKLIAEQGEAPHGAWVKWPDAPIVMAPLGDLQLVAQVYDTAASIHLYRLKALRGALKLEILGMRKKGRSVYALVKEEFGFKGGKAKVLKQLESKIVLLTPAGDVFSKHRAFLQA